MSSVASSNTSLFFAAGATVATLALAGTSIPIMRATDELALRPSVIGHGDVSANTADHVVDPATSSTPQNGRKSLAEQVKQIKERGSYTWDQVAKMFGVSRRTVHLWASGGRISAPNEEAIATVANEISLIENSNEGGTRLQFLALLDRHRSLFASATSDVNRPAATYSSGR